MTEPNPTAVVAVGEPQKIESPQFMLIMQDGPDNQVLIGGAQRPVEFDPKSPSHVIGKFIADNLELLIQIAQAEAQGGLRREGLQLLAPRTEPAGAGEKTIIVPGSDSQAVRS